MIDFIPTREMFVSSKTYVNPHDFKFRRTQNFPKMTTRIFFVIEAAGADNRFEKVLIHANYSKVRRKAVQIVNKKKLKYNATHGA